MSGDGRGLVRLGLLGLGLAGAGVVGGLAAQRAIVRRWLQEPEPAETEEPPLATLERWVVTDDGARLRVLDGGSGRPIVLLHGVTLSAQIWHYQLRELAAAGYRVLAFDLRGHGGSGLGAAPLSVERLAVDVRQVLDQLDLNDVVMVGHSMGGMVAMRCLSLDPATARGEGRVSSLALVATSASPVGGSAIPGAKVVAALARPLVTRTSWLSSRIPGGSLPGGDLGLLLTRAAFGADPSVSQMVLTETVVAAVPAKVTAELMLDIARFDESAALRAIDLPSLVVVGTNDLLTPRGQAQKMADAIGGAMLVVFEGCGHMVMLERHRELSSAVVDLASRSGRERQTPE